ncbi:HAD-IC family P-type ATPase [Candidatus Kaiserbacteria bacterium]|nr:HAD-IC family P-type ATPase [Candidatus Kaiserbacteria bacterium]
MALSRESMSAPFWSISVSAAADTLETAIHRGLSEEEAGRRLNMFGENSIERVHRSTALGIFLKQFESPLILILVGAALVTLSISHYRDTLFILVAVLANVALGFYQEHKAERALSELKSYLRERARIVRAGSEREIDAAHLVPGDLIRLSQGDRVPADARIVSANDLQLDEAILTGESLPVEKSAESVTSEAELADQLSLVFAGTLVTEGVGTAVVCRTGSATEFGKIATLVARAEHEATPLQAAIQTFSLRASFFLALLTVVVFIAGVAAGHSYIDMFLTSVAIAVAAIPEGLPVALTVILAVGVERMAKRNGVVRKLVAAEALGDVSVILTDKTGTLTVAKMELTHVVPLRGEDEQRVLECALLNANVLIENKDDPPSEWRVSGPIMEVALVRAAADRGIDVARVQASAKIEQWLPFNPVNKFSASLLSEGERHRIVLLGAPDVLIARSTLSMEERREMLSKIDALAREGKRVLGLASKESHRHRDFSLARMAGAADHLVLEGLIAFSDPVRATVPEAIRRVEAAGIRVVIVTGDHLGTAETIARAAGIPLSAGSAIEAAALMRLDDATFAKRLASLRVIARVSPLEKVRIVRALKKSGEVVAMTGDGVNDAPSIKEADVGVAMGSGTEVARSVADLVLLDDNFETIAAAVDEGRQIMANIQKVIVYLLSTVMDELVLIGGALIAGVALPLNALQILWVNFFSDSFPAVAFAFEKGIDGVSSRPRVSKRQLFDPLMRFLILVVGLSSSAFLLALYLALLSVGYDEALVRTFVFACFGSYTLLVAFSIKSLEKSIFSYSPFSNLYLVTGIGVGIALMLAAVYVPFLQSLFGTVSLPPLWLAAVLLVGALNIAAIEIGKWLFRGRML